MGKRTRKTRWRTLPIADEQSDSGESNSTLDTRIPPTYHQKYYSRFSYSSQSTPTRRYQSDGAKSTRSSSTTSENKITFNEDEYTRITTPRQDVLFKKGYLNKPKTYSTQTSTGNSTTSTGNSTGNGTPDYQSTDLEYESHFVFPNGFLDQNGIYYVNGFDPYPLMVYNTPAYYNNDVCGRTKKYSTESLAETGSTANEETSPDGVNHENHHQIGDEASGQHQQPPLTNGHTNNHPHGMHHHHHHHQHQHPSSTDYGHQVYNVVYPGFYYNGLCPPQDIANGHEHQSEPKRIKRRRRRKIQESDVHQQQNGTASEYTENEASSVEEEEENVTNEILPASENPSTSSSSSSSSSADNRERTSSSPAPSGELVTSTNEEIPDSKQIESDNLEGCEAPKLNDNNDQETVSNNINNSNNKSDHTAVIAESDNSNINDNNSSSNDKKNKYSLKADAQEFVPRTSSMHYLKMAPNFVHLPLVNHQMAPQNYNHHQAYLPPGIPVNFIQQSPHVYPGFVPNFAPPIEHAQLQIQQMTQNVDLQNTNNNNVQQQQQQTPEHQQNVNEHKNRGQIDINTVVSKLEEVVNEPSKSSESYLEKRKKQNASPLRKQKHYEQKYYLNKNNRYNNQNKSHNNRLQSYDNENSTKENKNNKKEEVINGKEAIENRTTVEKNENGSSQNIDSPKNVNGIIKDKENKNEEIKITVKEFTCEERNKNSSSHNNDQRKRWGRNTTEKKDQYVQHPSEDKPNHNQSFSYQRGRNNQNYRTNHQSPNQTPNRQRFALNSPVKNQNCKENVKKYSETVKKINQGSLFEVKTPIREAEEIVVCKTKNNKPEKPEGFNNTLMNKSQWISVSNKKKRRGRNQEEQEDLLDDDQNDFLQKMIMKSQLKDENQTINENSRNEVPDVIKKSPVRILEVRDIEKQLLNNVGVEVREEVEEKSSLSVPKKEEEVPEVVEHSKPKTMNKKKSKKSPPQNKQITKRVIITDVDLSEPTITSKKSEENLVESKGNEENVESVQEEIVTHEEPSSKVENVEEQTIISTVSEDKKTKKKKKKSSKTQNSITGVTNGNSWEDSYDFLLENTFSNKSEDKTNMEVSQELDLIIQRGMYNNLEEKIKSLNIIPIKEEFFQNVVRSSSRESSMEKTPDFSKFLTNSIPKFKYCMASVEDNAISDDKLPLKDLDQPSTSKNGLFVENREVNELLQDIYGEEGTPEVPLAIRTSPPKDIEKEATPKGSSKEPSVVREVDKEKLYPITQAVKNWMTKTRESTPEVEILKSPSVILREFSEKGKRCSSVAESEEEVTLFVASTSNNDDLLLDCWENEISQQENESSYRNSFVDTEKEDKMMEENDEDLEVYESKYGQNEDFLELQKEIEEKKKQESEARSRNFPKHGALPYRAICCSIM